MGDMPTREHSGGVQVRVHGLSHIGRYSPANAVAIGKTGGLTTRMERSCMQRGRNVLYNRTATGRSAQLVCSSRNPWQRISSVFIA